MEQTEVNGRIQSFDIIKGIMMIAIVLIHILYLAETSSDRPTSSSPIIVQMLYLGMMLFFISSGYFYRPNRTPSQNIKRRFVQLIIPIVVGNIALPTILFVYLTILGQNPTLDDLLPSYKAVIGGVNVFRPYGAESLDVGMCFVYNGYYFLQIMTVAFVFFYLIVDKVLDDPKKLVVAIIIMITGTVLLREFVDIKLPFYCQLSPLATAFMLVGAAMGRRKMVENIEYGKKDSKYWLMFIGALAIGAVVTFLFPTGTSFDATYFGEYGGYSAYPYFIAACFTGYALLVFASWLAKVPVISTLFAVSGRHTIALICWHIFVIKLFMVPMHHLSSKATFPAVPMAEAIVIWLLSVVIIVVCAEYLPKYIASKSKKKAEQVQ